MKEPGAGAARLFHCHYYKGCGLEELADLEVDLLDVLRRAIVLLAAGGVGNRFQIFYVGVTTVGDGKDLDAFARVGAGGGDIMKKLSERGDAGVVHTIGQHDYYFDMPVIRQSRQGLYLLVNRIVEAS